MYPSTSDIANIASWSGTPRELVEFLSSIWEYNQDDWTLKVGRDGVRGKKVYRVTPSTWGWSGNEEIIGALEGSWFWMLFWRSHRRGGHYQFEIAPYWIDHKTEIGYGQIIKPSAGATAESQLPATPTESSKEEL